MKKWMIIFCLVTSVFASAELPSLAASDMVKNVAQKITWSESKYATVVVFIASTCPCCLGHETRLKELANKYPQFKFVGVHSNKNEDEKYAKTYFEKTNFPFVVLDDVNQSIANAFGALKTPHVFIVNPKGQIVFEGGVDDTSKSMNAKKHYLETALEQILKKQTPNPSVVKTLGCAIQRIKK